MKNRLRLNPLGSSWLSSVGGGSISSTGVSVVTSSVGSSVVVSSPSLLNKSIKLFNSCLNLSNMVISSAITSSHFCNVSNVNKLGLSKPNVIDSHLLSIICHTITSGTIWDSHSLRVSKSSAVFSLCFIVTAKHWLC